MTEFLLKWQTLIGAALGPFLLGLGAWFKGVISKKEVAGTQKFGQLFLNWRQWVRI